MENRQPVSRALIFQLPTGIDQEHAPMVLLSLTSIMMVFSQMSPARGLSSIPTTGAVLTSSRSELGGTFMERPRISALPTGAPPIGALPTGAPPTGALPTGAPSTGAL